MKRISCVFLSLIMLGLSLTGCSARQESSDIADYEDYLAEVESAADHMPAVEEMGAYSSVEITHDYNSLVFSTYTIGVYLTYEETAYEDQVRYINENYDFFTECPDDHETDFYAETDGYKITMVDADYQLDEVYKNGLLIGLNEEAHKICYLFFYDPDLDSLRDLDTYIYMYFTIK